MENKLNGELYKMDQIPAKLFNSQYLSDITFVIEGKQIYAHSLLLMVRSSVFQQQLEQTLGEAKLIPITDYGYDTFYQFIRFLYTDQMTISDTNWFHLMKLAKKYNVIRLVNHLMMNNCSETKMFDVCVLKTYKVCLKTLKLGPTSIFDKILRSDEFLSIHPDVLEEILKVDQIKEGITESNIIDALARWMNHHCKQNNIQFSECRIKFDRLVRLIRFPTISNNELQLIQIKHPDLLTKSDIMNIDANKIYGAAYDEGLFNFVPRLNINWPYELKTYILNYCCSIKFSVSSDMILGGLVLGGKGRSGNQPRNFTFYQVKDDKIGTNCNSINLGCGISILVRPTYIYTIEWYSGMLVKYWCRKHGTNVIVNAPPKGVKFIGTPDPTLLEILFLKPDGSTFD